MTHLYDEGKACNVSVSSNPPSGPTSEVPSLRPDLVARARDLVEYHSPHGHVPVGAVSGLLTAYDNLAARFAILAASVVEDE
jgi:hypothetical protein